MRNCYQCCHHNCACLKQHPLAGEVILFGVGKSFVIYSICKAKMCQYVISVFLVVGSADFLPSICKFLISSWLNPSSWGLFALSSAIWKSSSSSSEKLSVDRYADKRQSDHANENVLEIFMQVLLLLLLLLLLPFGSGWRLWQCFTALKISSMRLSSCGQNQISVIGGSSSICVKQIVCTRCICKWSSQKKVTFRLTHLHKCLHRRRYRCPHPFDRDHCHVHWMWDNQQAYRASHKYIWWDHLKWHAT